MSLTSRLANLFSANDQNHSTPPSSHGDAFLPDTATRSKSSVFPFLSHVPAESAPMEAEEEEARPPYAHAMIAGGIGGTTGDLLLHSVDTVKTRQQGDPRIPPRYTSMSSTYATIFRQEGIRRGLYSGVTPAFLGSFPGTVIFFGTYEYSKRHLIDAGVPNSLAYLAGGFLADLAASVLYVPSEVLKTRLQLQGRPQNPFFSSGTNYLSTPDAFRTIVRTEGLSALFHGYKATIFRDLPFSALQFAFYEQERRVAKRWKGNKDIGLGLEIVTGMSAGGLAGVITLPLDVVKTRIQTQINPEVGGAAGKAVSRQRGLQGPGVPATSGTVHQAQASRAAVSPPQRQRRPISTSSPSTHIAKPGTVNLDTSSVLTGLKIIYKTEGIAGWFRGVGPRFLWTSVQSGTMLVLYQMILKQLDTYSSGGEDAVSGVG